MGQDMPGMTAPPRGAPVATSTPDVAGPADHAADRFYDPTAMAAARALLAQEHGGGTYSKVTANLAEYQAGPGGGGYHWQAEAWAGGDINRFVVKSQGEGSRRQGLEAAEVQALYSRATGPYVDLQVGVRQDFRPGPSRTYVTVGLEGLAPYGFDVQGAVFVSSRGEILGRLEGAHDLRLTQRWILQPRAEINVAAQDAPEVRIGSGVSNADLDAQVKKLSKIGDTGVEAAGSTPEELRSHIQREVATIEGLVQRGALQKQ